MTARRHSRIAPVCLLVAMAAPAAADTPARFTDGEDGLASRIEFPEIRGDGLITLRCAAKVSKGGDMDDNGCISADNNSPPFVEAINKAARKADMVPAVIDGKNRAVYVQYQVRFRKEGEEQTITVFNNPGLPENVEAYGEDHVAAQRTLTDEGWQKVCPRQTRFLVWAKAHVAATGEQSSINFAPNEGPSITGQCKNAIIATLQEASFAPALADGDTVPSSYIEPFGNF